MHFLIAKGHCLLQMMAANIFPSLISLFHLLFPFHISLPRKMSLSAQLQDLGKGSGPSVGWYQCKHPTNHCSKGMLSLHRRCARFLPSDPWLDPVCTGCSQMCACWKVRNPIAGACQLPLFSWPEAYSSSACVFNLKQTKSPL